VARAVTVAAPWPNADTVLAESLEGLRTVADGDLEQVPDNRAHLARHPAYHRAEYLAEGQNMWSRTLAEVIIGDMGTLAPLWVRRGSSGGWPAGARIGDGGVVGLAGGGRVGPPSAQLTRA